MDTKKKRTPNQKKKAIVSVLLMVAILITGAFAFLSATDSKTNVFTVGNVKIKLSEEFDTNQNGSIEKTNDENDEVYDASETQVSLKGEILPGQKVIKRPYIENTGKNKAWVYITVGIPTTNSDNTFRNKDTGETSITGQNVDIPIQAYAIQENYANKTTYKDVWNAYFADKVTDTFGAEITDAKTLSERVPLFEILNKTRFNEPTPDNISVDDNIPNDDWENIGITVDGQEKSYYKSANYDYYVFAYKTLLDPTADGAEQLSRTSDVFEGVRLLKDIGEAQPSKLNYYVKESAGDTLNGEVDLSVEPSTYESYKLIKTEYYMPGERVRNLYYDDTLAETGYSFNWNFMNDKTKSAYSGMTITQDTDLVATYEDTVSDAPKEPTEVPVVKYSPSGYLGYAIEQNEEDKSYYATLIGADDTRSDCPESATEVIVPSHVIVGMNTDGTKCLSNGVLMYGSLDKINVGISIPVKKIQLAEWQWNPTTNTEAAHEAIALGKIAKKLNISGTNIEEIKFCGDIYQHNLTSGFVLEDIGTLPSSLTTLNDKAFYSCVNLKNVTMPNFLISVGRSAFESCKSLNKIDISNSVTDIDERVFWDCAGLTNITIPNSVTNIGSSAFRGCAGLTSVTIPDSVTSIGDDVFYSCANLTNVTLPDSVTSIENRTFMLCNNLTKINIPDSVISIGDYAFGYCDHLTSITIPNGIISIGDYTFGWCAGLTSITIPDSVKSIGKGAFRGCEGLTDIIIPDSVTSIGDDVFYSCTNLTNVILPDSVTSIGNSAFGQCSSLTNIVIPNGVTNIGDDAFVNCWALTNVTIPASVTSIGDSVFWSCSSLINVNVSEDNKNYTSKDGILYTKDFSELLIYPDQNTTKNLVLPEGLKKIPDFVFDSNDYIKSIIIPSTVTEIGSSIINNNEIESIVINSDNSKYDSRNDCNAIIETATNTLITGCKNTKIPNGVTSIGREAFMLCNNLTSITIPDSVISIGEGAFANCNNLTSITLLDGITSIGNNVFLNCKKITNIIVPESVTQISNTAFSGCDSLSSIVVNKNNKTYDSRNDCNAIIETATNTLIAGCKNTVIPDGITSIGDGAFGGCEGLTDIIIPDSVTSIGWNAFASCTKLTNITIPDSVANIGGCAFGYCKSLTSITIPNMATKIDWATFQGCIKLTSVTIPKSVTYISGDAFENCPALTNIIYQSNVSDWAKVDCPPGSFASGLTITCTDGTVTTQ